MNGFRSTGLWSFNDQMFTDEDFIAANLTEEGPTDTNISTAVTDLSSQSPQPGTSKESEPVEILTCLCSPTFINSRPS